MSQAPGPSALLRRLQHVSPLVRYALVASVALGLGVTATIALQAVALATALARLFAHPSGSLRGPVLLFLIATAARALLSGASEPLIARVARPLRRTLRERTLARVLREGPLGTVDATTQLATTGIEAIENYLAAYVPSLVLATLAPLVLLGWLATHDRWSFLIVSVSLLLLPIFMVLLGLEARDKMNERWREQQILAGYFGDVVRGMGVLKAFNRDEDALRNLDEVGASLRRVTMRTLRVAFLSSFALELLASLATALVALVLGLRLLNGSLHLNVALAVLLVTPEVFLPLRRSSAQFHASANGIAAAQELLAFVEDDDASATTRPPTSAPRLVLREVVVRHEARRVDAAQPICAELPAGGLLVLEGPSGVGKTTLLRCLARLRDVASGDVEIDGLALTSLDRVGWQAAIGYVPQDARLPGRTVAEVLRAGDETIPDEALEVGLRQVGLDLPLERPVGEGAAALSAGQRRRLALVRALVRQPVLLLLDEPLAHLDDETAARIAAVIRSLPMTRVVATHRPLEGDVHVHLHEVVA